ncbi:Nn.00g001190.m01.CDS01 [Neocucurbitaria sp. VM-36]
MFSPAIGRAARSATTFSTAPASCLARAALNTAHQPFRPTHQRRLSSSKPSTPPSNKKKPAEIDQNAAAELQGSGKRTADSQKKLKEPSTATSGNNIPFVPPTNHLREDDVKLSAFFGLHRPISISRSFPEVAPIDVFNAIFEVGRPNDAEMIQRTKDVLSGFVERIHAELDAQEERRADAAQAQEIYHLDELPLPTQQSVENFAARLVPFSPPAAPVPYDPLATESEAEAYSSYDVSASINQRITEVPLPTSQTQKATTFREHVARRRYGMLLISVKRQRKLKMKKHKYKKLMKRTRLLRRKLDRT